MSRTSIDATRANTLEERLMVNIAEKRGIDIGIALAAAMLIRDWHQPTIALEILENATIDADRVRDLDMDEYDTEHLLKVLEPTP